MAKEAVFTMKLEQELRDAFAAEAAALDRSQSQIVREFMRGFVEKQSAEREYADFYRRKVELARKSIDAGIGRPDDEVRADFARRIAELRKAGRKSA
jgi:predicted transcriptional regulator